MSISVTTNVSEAQQEGAFQNATLQGFGARHVISIAVTLDEDAMKDVDANDAAQVEVFLAEIFASAVEAGCKIEAQVGLSTDAEPDDHAREEDADRD